MGDGKWEQRGVERDEGGGGKGSMSQGRMKCRPFTGALFLGVWGNVPIYWSLSCVTFRYLPIVP